MTQVRLFILGETAAFATAALVHFGTMIGGYEHRRAGTAESVIAAVLLSGLVFTLIVPAATRRVGAAVQAFALLGTMVGLFTIAIGVGPRTAPDIPVPRCHRHRVALGPRRGRAEPLEARAVTRAGRARATLRLHDRPASGSMQPGGCI